MILTIWNDDYKDFPLLKETTKDWYFQGLINIVQRAKNFIVISAPEFILNSFVERVY